MTAGTDRIWRAVGLILGNPTAALLVLIRARQRARRWDEPDEGEPVRLLGAVVAELRCGAPPNGPDEPDLDAVLRHALYQLPAMDREALVWSSYLGLAERDAATLLGVTTTSFRASREAAVIELERVLEIPSWAATREALARALEEEAAAYGPFPVGFTTSKRRRVGLVAVCGVLGVVAIVAGALLLHGSSLSTAGVNRSPGFSPTPVPAGEGNALALLVSVAPAAGWAVTTSPNLVLRTTDGGHHWINVSPPMPPTSAEPTTVLPYFPAFFLDRDHAWVTMGAADIPAETLTIATVYATADGGRTWHLDGHVPAGAGRNLLAFADAHHGLYAQAFTADQPGAVLATSDGGARWQRLAALPASPPEPRACQIANLGLATAREWIVVYDCETGPPVVATTYDGGTNWSYQTVPAPPNLSPDEFLASSCSVGAVRVWPGRNGALVVSVATRSAPGQTVVYVSDPGNGGWTPVPLPAEPAPPSGAIDLTPQRGDWIFSDGRQLYVTADSGQHWTTQRPNLDLKNLTFDFVSARSGWSTILGGDGATLYLSTDGGRHWNGHRLSWSAMSASKLAPLPLDPDAAA